VIRHLVYFNLKSQRWEMQPLYDNETWVKENNCVCVVRRPEPDDTFHLKEGDYIVNSFPATGAIIVDGHLEGLKLRMELNKAQEVVES